MQLPVKPELRIHLQNLYCKSFLSRIMAPALIDLRNLTFNFVKEISALVLCPNFATYAVYLHYMWLSK